MTDPPEPDFGNKEPKDFTPEEKYQWADMLEKSGSAKGAQWVRNAAFADEIGLHEK